MHTSLRPLAASISLALLAGCTSGNGGVEPPFTSVNLKNDKLQLAVGVATFIDGTKGLNVVSTFRQPDGLSATLLNTPTLTGPFTVPAGAVGTESAATAAVAECSPNVDAGTGHITGSAQALPGTVAACTTFGQGGGVFSYGFAPENSTTSQAPVYNLYGDLIDSTSGGQYGGPFYGADGLIDAALAESATISFSNSAYRGGPPAYPYVRDGTFPTGFLGYTLGITTFDLAPVAGTYNLSVNVPSANNPGANLAAPAAKLANAVGLPVFAAAPTFAEDGTGAGTAACTAPAGVTETLIEVVDFTTDSFYTQVVAGGGAVSYKFADDLGPAVSPSTVPTATLNAGDAYEVACIGVDYPLYEAGPPKNVQQTPTILGTGGQSDITFAHPAIGTYGMGVAPAAIVRHGARRSFK